MRDGIRVNAVAPGFIETPMTGAMTEETRDRVANRPAGPRAAGSGRPARSPRLSTS